MKRVYVIGDSISIQYGPYLQRALRGVMEYGRKEGEEEARCNLDHPQGANGGDSSMVLDFLRARSRAGGIAADLLLLNCGLHDIKTNPATGGKQVPLERYRENLEAIAALASQLRPALVWMRTTPRRLRRVQPGRRPGHGRPRGAHHRPLHLHRQPGRGSLLRPRALPRAYPRPAGRLSGRLAGCLADAGGMRGDTGRSDRRLTEQLKEMNF
ncbi:MAG: SGNH/GDSL hydrolase family protein [Candidatus Latescibacteria bacterium]|nr:SGNH/GDSL hydrolase family protein [Candidatus Latescibacterota bacterium]